MSSISHLLLDHLDDLFQEDFERFKSFLMKNVAQGFPPIPRSRLENAKQNKVVELMVDQYGESDAARITVQILQDIKQNKLASDLEKKLKELQVSEAAGEGRSAASSDPDYVRKAQRAAVLDKVNKDAEFVDEHRVELIQGVRSVMEIADSLLSKRFITNEMYSEINQETTSQNQMRKVYDFLNTRAAKAEFYNLLQEKESWLIDELQ